jgi:arabinofuranosyltransferase
MVPLPSATAPTASIRPLSRSALLGHEGGILLALLGASLGLLAHDLYYLNALGFDAIDDAYISFRYAANLVGGNGLVFNVGQHVQGYTNFLWTLLMAPAIAVHLPPGGASLLLGGLSGWVALLMTARLTFPRQRGIGAAAAVLLAADGSFALWSVSGMETSFFTMLIVAGAVRYWREMEQPGRWPWSGLLFALATLARPEGGMVFALTVLHAIACCLLTNRRPFRGQDAGRLLLYALPVAAYLLFCWRYYGSIVPNTYTDKVDLGVLAQVVRGWGALAAFAGIHGGWPVVVPLALGCWALWHQGEALRTSYCLLIALPYLAYIVVVGGDWSVGRFFVPILAFLYLLAAAGLAVVVQGVLHLYARVRAPAAHRAALGGARRYPTGGASPWLLVPVALALAVPLFVASSAHGERTLFVDRFHVKQVGEARTAMGRWLRTNAAPNASIAVDAAGQMPYYGGHTVIDLYGLNTPAIARLPVNDIGTAVAGHEKFGLDYAIRVLKPDYIAIYGNVLDAPVYRTQYHRLTVAWTSDRVLRSLLSVYERNAPSRPTR